MNLNLGVHAAEIGKRFKKLHPDVRVELDYTTPFELMTAPFALSLGRKGRVLTVGYAIGIWLHFMGINSAIEQFGVNGVMSAKIAVWSPILFFSMVGVF